MVENNTLPSYMNTGADTVNDDEAELRAAFTAYDEAWQNLDVEAILGYYHYPCMLLTSVGVLVKNSAEQLRPFITGIVNDMNSANFPMVDTQSATTYDSVEGDTGEHRW